MITFDRYSKFRNNGEISMVPFIPIPKRDTDKYVIYEVNKTRLDILSGEYYNSPDYAWFILQANAEYGANEYSIPDKTLIRIPYPLTIALNGYVNDIEEFMHYYGYNE